MSQLENNAENKYELALDGLPRAGVLELYFVSNKPVECSEVTVNQFTQVMRTLQQNLDQADERHASQLVASISEMYSFSSSQAKDLVTKFQSSSAKVRAQNRTACIASLDHTRLMGTTAGVARRWAKG
jgi:hypothetical protein